MPPSEEMVEVYRCNAGMEADRAIVEILEPAGIEAFLRDRVSHAMPAPDATPGNYFIAVAAEDAVTARAALREALEDEALDPAEGEVIEPEDDEDAEDEDAEEEV